VAPSVKALGPSTGVFDGFEGHSQVSEGSYALRVREMPSEALRLAGRFARALESYLAANGGAAPRAQIVAVVRAWVPRWDSDIPPLLADALIEGLVRQGRVVATRHHVGLCDAVERWRVRFTRSPQRLSQPAEQVARDCDVPVSAIVALRALVRQTAERLSCARP
jgi:hypothetical protein